MAQRPTIKDVALKSGFSISTVSMVMNNKEVSIPAETREKVLRAATSLGYRPNRLALSLLTKRTMMLGLIIPDNSSLFFAGLSKAIEVEARNAGYGLIYGNSDNSTANDLSYMEMFMDYQVDGYILTLSPFQAPEDEDETRRQLERASVPVVLVDRQVRECNLHMLQMDHYRGGYLVADYLLKLGHRRIGSFCSPGYISSREEKAAGYRAAYRDHGLDPDQSFFPLYIDTSAALSEKQLRLIMDNGLTAVQVISDSMAVELYRIAARHGVRIPRDLSVVGHDDLFFSDMLTPPLTTVRQPIREIGRATIQTMLGLIQDGHKGPGEKNVRLFQPHLIIRESTAPPAGV